METARWSDAPKEPPAPPAPRVDATRPTLRGLLWLGVIALLFSVARAGMERAFIPHWWAKW